MQIGLDKNFKLHIDRRNLILSSLFCPPAKETELVWNS